MAMSKNHKIIIAVVVSVLVLTGLAVGLYFALRPNPAVEELRDIVQRAKNTPKDDAKAQETILKDLLEWVKKYGIKIESMSKKDQRTIGELRDELNSVYEGHARGAHVQFGQHQNTDAAPVMQNGADGQPEGTAF
ncbi:Cathepsin propeptide inhibitor domain-containing protein [Plasmodiophora brassicae]